MKQRVILLAVLIICLLSSCNKAAQVYSIQNNDTIESAYINFEDQSGTTTYFDMIGDRVVIAKQSLTNGYISVISAGQEVLHKSFTDVSYCRFYGYNSVVAIVDYLRLIYIDIESGFTQDVDLGHFNPLYFDIWNDYLIICESGISSGRIAQYDILEGSCKIIRDEIELGGCFSIKDDLLYVVLEEKIENNDLNSGINIEVYDLNNGLLQSKTKSTIIDARLLVTPIPYEDKLIIGQENDTLLYYDFSNELLSAFKLFDGGDAWRVNWIVGKDGKVYYTRQRYLPLYFVPVTLKIPDLQSGTWQFDPNNSTSTKISNTVYNSLGLYDGDLYGIIGQRIDLIKLGDITIKAG